MGFRVGLLYLFLYGVPYTVSELPLLSWLGEKYQAVWGPFVRRVGGALLATPVPPRAPNGSGDQLYFFAEILCMFLVSVLGAIAWSLADRRRANHRELAEALRIYLRYLLAFTMLTYGMVKVLKSQFPEPSPVRLVTPLGQMSPMGLLWTFMGHSTAYTVFAGLAEVAGGALLLFRRTTTLGALVLVAVLANVALLNYAFDVPVKLFSSHLLLMAVILLAPDLRRLLDLLVRNRATRPADLGAPPVPPHWRRALPIAKGVVIAAMLAHVLWTAVDGYRSFGDGVEPLAIEGAYRVVAPPEDPDGWRQVAIARRTFAAVTADGRVVRYALEHEVATGALLLTEVDDPRRSAGRLTVTAGGGEIHLAGALAGVPVSLRLRRVDPTEFLLTRRGFHWVNDAPYNR